MDFVKLARTHQEEMLNDLFELIKIESTYDETTISTNAPFGQKIREALDAMLLKGKQDGFTTKDIDGYAGRISYGNGQTSVSLLGHLDVVPGLKEQFNPFIKEGFVVGRGSLDDKGPTLAAYYAMRILKDCGYQFKHRIDLIVGCDEENEMRCMEYYKQHEELPLKGLVPDADFPGVFAEKGILNVDLVLPNDSKILAMKAGTRPNVVIAQAVATLEPDVVCDNYDFYLRSHQVSGEQEANKLTLNGEAYHASQPYLGKNAGLLLLNYIATLTSDDSLLNVIKHLSNEFGLGFDLEYESAQMGPLTINVGLIHVDENEIRLTLDIRYPKELNAQEILKTIASKGDWALENILDSHPHYVNPNMEFVQSALAAYQKVTGDVQSDLKSIGGGTYARTFPNHIAFGLDFPTREKPAWVQGPHQDHEAVEIEALILATAIYCEALITLAEKI